jgi:hypothetical protein
MTLGVTTLRIMTLSIMVLIVTFALIKDSAASSRVMLSVSLFIRVECRYAQCRYPECRGATEFS